MGFALYSLAVQLIEPKVTKHQNQMVKNYSVAENYIYKEEIPRALIVGSSMAARLFEEKFSSDTYNLSFSGGTALTGLNIIKENNKLPDVIFIETNLIERNKNQKMIDILFKPLISKINGKYLSLQYTYQPINILLTVIAKYFGSSETEKLNYTPNKKLLEENLARQMETYNNVGDINLYEILSEFKKIVTYFEKLGVEVVFFQMPVHKSILATKVYQNRRSVMLKMFPNSHFYWIDKDDFDIYKTTDGIHLQYKSASEYSDLLSRILQKYLTN